jgi:uncharacterized phage-like protein YoqJ
MRVAVTGHRPQHLKLEDGYWIQHEFDRLIKKIRPTIAISGMALGADTWWANAAVTMLPPYGPVSLHAYVPFPGQDERWREDDRIFYRQMLAQATEIITVCLEYSPAAFELRNRAMIDNCDLLIAAWNGKRSGGTFNAVTYAKKKDMDIVYVDPVRRVTTISRSSESADFTT